MKKNGKGRKEDKKFIHDMGMSVNDAICYFERILASIGLKIREKFTTGSETRISASGDNLTVNLTFTPEESKILGIPRTIVEILCPESLHEKIQDRIRVLRCGG